MWTQAIADYTAHLSASGAPAGTVRLRHHYLRNLALQCAGTDPWSVTLDDLVRFVGRNDWSAETRKSARGSVRSFYTWAEITERITTNPARRLPSVRIPLGVPKPTPLSLVRHAISAASERDKLMVMLAVLAGLRRAEIASVHTSDLFEDLVGTSLRVTGKGGRTRNIPLDVDLAAQLLARPAGFVFPGRIEGHLSPDRVGKVLKNLLGDGWSGHSLRHRFATSAYAVDHDLFAVQRLLGHSKPETTARYTAIPDESLRAAVVGVGAIIAA